MQIIALTPDDWQVFRAVRLAMLADAPEAFASTLEDESKHDEAAWRAVLAARMQVVARDERGEVLGTAGGVGDGPTLELIAMWVAPGARRHGVGEALVRRIIELGCTTASRQILLEVAEDNPAAERLYIRCGFSRTGATGPIRSGEPRMRAEMRLALIA